MEWRDCQAEIQEYNAVDPAQLKQIVEQGINTEFWKWFRSKLAQTMQMTEAELLRRRVASFDDAVRLGQLSAVFKTVEELFNAPNMALQMLQKATAVPTSTTAQRKPSTSVKKGENK